jgi:hypothetical protein
LLKRVNLGDGQSVAPIVAAKLLNDFSNSLGKERNVAIERGLDLPRRKINLHSQHWSIREFAKPRVLARWSIAAPEDDANLLKGYCSPKAPLPLVEEVLQTANEAGQLIAFGRRIHAEQRDCCHSTANV